MEPIDNFLEASEEHLRQKLPTQNGAVRAGEITLEAFMAWAESFLGAYPASLNDRELAKRALTQVFLVINSAERHHIEAGAQPGDGLLATKGLDLVQRLSTVAGHPPFPTAYTYWLWNATNPLTFTGTEGERYFNYSVAATNKGQGASNEAIRSICSGDLPTGTTQANDAIAFAASQYTKLRATYEEFLKHMSVDNFLAGWRQYLLHWHVNGLKHGPINAVNISSAISADFLLGTVESFYETIVIERFPYLLDDDRAEVVVDMQMDSLTTCLLRALNIPVERVQASDMATLAGDFAAATTSIKRTGFAYAALVEAVASLSAKHYGLIHTYLVQGQKGYSPEYLQSLPVPAGSGVSHTGHGVTKRIHDMRQRHPVIAPLVAAIRLYERSYAAA
ncbi:MAG: hypothetical protein ABIT01_12240 [Thermoanaerobaculia bacterium]